jgi:sigma-B regulation protein RsbU (phosphoserine phosphatase)
MLAVVGPVGAAYAATKGYPTRFQSLGFIAAIVAAAMVGRLLAGLIALAVTAASAEYFLLSPAGFGWPGARDVIELGALLVLGAFLASMMIAMQRARARALQALAAARQAERRLGILGQASAAMSATFDIAATAQSVCQLVVDVAGWEQCAVALADGPAMSALASASAVPPGRPRRWWRRPTVDPAPVDAVALPTGLRTARMLEPDGALHGIGAWQCRSGLLVPLTVADGTAGLLLLLDRTHGRRYTAAELAFATELAGRISSALAAARRYEAEAHIAQTLQRNLLPRQLPTVPGTLVHAAYHAGGRTVAGGDFYDLFAINERQWLVAVGDVCGQGPEAASVMGITRASLRAIALREHHPGQLLALANDALFDQVADHRFVSACVATLEPRSDGSLSITMSRAGHPPAIVRRADGSTCFVSVHGGPVLGVLPAVTIPEESFILSPGDRLVLYTDGIERPNEPADGVALRLVAEHGGETPESITGHFAEGMRSGAAGNADDLAVVVIAVGDPGLRPLARLARAVQRMNVF